ncbi:hypothetical protein Tco_0514291 [Tanacetum coccineum]
MTHPHPNRRFVPQAVLTRSGKLNTVRPVNTANSKAVNTVRPVNTTNSKAVNTVRPVNTANSKAVNTVRPVNTAVSKLTLNCLRPMSNTFKRGHSQVTRPFNKNLANNNSIFNKKVNTVTVNDTTARERAVGNPQQKEYKEKAVIDSGCSRNMT